MAGERRKRESYETRQVLGKTRLPHKFCPYCGTRNEAYDDTCAGCSKDISWMRVPEPVPVVDTPKQKPRELPEQRKAFSRRNLVIILIIVALIIAAIIVTSAIFGKKSSSTSVLPAAALLSGLVVPLVHDRRPPPRCPRPGRLSGGMSRLRE